MRSIAVLLWKHAMARKRRFILTAISLLSPLMYFALVLTIIKELDIFSDDQDSEVVQRSKQMRLSDNTPLEWETPIMDTKILYYPRTPFTDAIMNEAGEKLFLRRLGKFSVENMSSVEGYFPYTDENQFKAFVNVMGPGDAVIIFHNLDSEFWPSKLNYTIRMKENFRTDTYKSDDSIPKSHEIFGLQYLTFMRLQWAIDSSYIKQRSGKYINQTVSLEEFPYSKSADKVVMMIVCYVSEVLTWLSLLFVYVELMCGLLAERASGIQELIKMTGVHSYTIAFCHYLSMLPSGLVFSIGGATLYKIHPALIPNTNGFYLFLMLILYFNTIMAMAIVCSYIVKRPDYSTVLAVMSYGVFWIPIRELYAYQLPRIVKLFSGLLPSVPMIWFWRELSVIEMHDRGIDLNTMRINHTNNTESVFSCYVFMVVQTVLYACLAGYLSKVRPGLYGQALPWNYFMKSRAVQRIPESEEIVQVQDRQYFEEPPAGLKVGIFVDHVTKVYPNQIALRDVTLKVFEGEIMVLLGHNGAGKTTLMSIITGMTSPTAGQVYVHGFNTMTQKKEVRNRIGLCPQHNVFFADLTVQEHIMFFTMLKLGSYAEARRSSRRLAEQLNLGDKLGTLCATLSGGMKRRVQLACALTGDSDVLVLDEPTSGLDVETRRELWDLLLFLRGARTVLLSTHFMEEADVLGDRVAALNAGELRCFATNMFLKKAIGDGYRLTLTTKGPPNTEAITNKILERVPNASVKDTTMHSVSYTLPATATHSFPELFKTLEDNASKLNINSIGVGVSTLEEVFLKLCSDTNTESDADTTETLRTSTDTTFVPEWDPMKYFTNLQGVTQRKLSGCRLYLRQFKVLFMRQLRFILSRKWIFLTLQVLLPLFLIFLITSNFNNANKEPPRSLPLDLDIYEDMPNKRVLYNIQWEESNTPLLRTMKAEYPGVQFESVNVRKLNSLEYNKYLTGLEVNDTSAKVLYTTSVRHAAPVALNMLSNLLGMRYLNWPSSQIFTNNHQIEGMLREKPKEPKTFGLSYMWALMIMFFSQTAILHCSVLPCRERLTGSRHIHIMSGCPSELYWITTLIFHLFITFLFLILPTIVAAMVLEQDSTINQIDFIFVLMLLLTLGCSTMLSLIYLISCYFNERITNIILVASLFVFGLFCPLTKTTYEYATSKRPLKPTFYYYLVEASYYIAPPHTMTISACYSVKLAAINAACDLKKDTCPTMVVTSVSGWNSGDVKMCCAGKKPRSYFSTGEPLLTAISILVAQFLVLMNLLFLAQRGLFNWLWDRVRNINYQALPDDEENAKVRAERTYVEHEIIKSAPNIKKDSILVKDVHKNYHYCLKSCNAVKGISFSVKKGECFGLLGVNGAGKSTTFKMLTAEECTTRGAIFGNGYHLKRGNANYLQSLGYCPQFFGLDRFLTGTQNLTLLLTLRGLERESVKKEVKGWIEIVGLEKYASRAVAGYSGGCVRRLGAAAALCGGAGVTLLDEPSAGVDVAARRRLWAALRQGLRQRRAIIITSHSMDEMEALCGRIAIMCAGRMRALGSPATLRAEHAAGHAVIFKIKHTASEEEDDGPGRSSTVKFESLLTHFKTKVRGTFNCDLKDEHKTMLHYHINETMRYSELFGALEKLREQFPTVVEDYSVTETTLEEVFLSFAKGNRHEDNV